MKVKCVLPRNYYLLRSVAMKQNGEIINRIRVNEITDISGVNGHVKFKLDYHRTDITIPSYGKDVFLILYFEIRNNFPYYLIDTMFKNCLRAKILSEEEFDGFDESFYNEKPKELVRFGSTEVFISILGFLISIGILVVPFMKVNPGTLSDFVFLIGIFSFSGQIATILMRKYTSAKQYYHRALMLGILGICLFLYIDTEVILRNTALVLSLCMIVVSTYWLIREARS